MQNKEKEYDTVNAVFVLWIAYRYKWKVGSKDVGSVSYFLRYTNDKDYDGNVSEVNRCFKILSERLSLDYLEEGNPMTTAILYRNLNRGRSLQGIINPEILRIDFTDGFMQKQATIYSKNMKSENEKIGWTMVCQSLEEYSKTQQSQLETT